MKTKRLLPRTVLLLCAWSAAAAESPPIPVAVAPVEWCDRDAPVRAPGTLARKTVVNLAFPAEGILRALSVRAGERVKKGEELASLDLDDIDARLARAAAAEEKARRDAERSRTLFAQGVIGEEERDNAQTALALAEASLKSARFLRRYAVIEAPADGVILRRLAEPDQTVAAGQPIIGFAADDGWLVRVGLSERDLLRVRVGDRARVTPAARPDLAFSAVVSHIAATADERTRATEVEMIPEAVPDSLRSGFVVHVEIAPQPVTPRPKIPVSSLVEGHGNRAGVYLLESSGHRVRRVEVVVERIEGQAAYVRGDMPPGARVVTRGAEFLRDEARVRSMAGGSP